jgi:microcystin-dependent protein
MPSHTHLLNANTASGTTATPNNTTYLASPYANGTAQKFYNTAAGTGTLGASTILTAGGSIPFSIMQPVMAVNYLIAMYGIFPTRN